MTPDDVTKIGQEAMYVALLVGLPILLIALVVGLTIGVFQAATQINEMTLSFIPKLLAMVATLYLGGPWFLRVLIEYIQNLYRSVPFVIG